MAALERQQDKKVAKVMNKVDESSLRRDVIATRDTIDRVTQVVDANTRTFSSALGMVDSQLHVMQRALNDVVRGSARIDENGDVDFNSYLGEYFAVMGFAEFVVALKNAATEQPEEEPENVVVFGG